MRPGERVEEKARRGACTDARAFVVGTGYAVNEPRNPLAQSTDRMSGDRDAGCPFFWFLFFGHAKKRDPLAAEASGTLANASVVTKEALRRFRDNNPYCSSS